MRPQASERGSKRMTTLRVFESYKLSETPQPGREALNQSELGARSRIGSSQNADIRTASAYGDMISDLIPLLSHQQRHLHYIYASHMIFRSPNERRPPTLDPNHLLITKGTNKNLQ
jgi:hypothetical protein